MKSLLKDLASLAVTQNLSVSQLVGVQALIDADILTLRNGLISIGELMALAGESSHALGANHLGNIGDLLALIGNQIDALHSLEDQADYLLAQGGE